MDGTIAVETVAGDPVAGRRLEFVERKGLGHPDSICDGVAEAVSRALSRHYRAAFGRICHHNTDKIHLSAGRAESEFGGGEVLEPIYLLIGGRATRRVDGQRVPVDEIAVDAARRYLTDTLATLDPGDVEIEAAIGEASPDLQALFEGNGRPRANDTSFGVGHAPLSPTERAVRTLEPELRGVDRAVGADVKVMAARLEDRLHVTVAAALVDRHVDGLETYRAVVDAIREAADRHLRAHVDGPVSVVVNAADDYEAGSVYLTTTGLSAEMGDDGGVGRGNRANGLITPHRPMSLEATAGKNPVSHVGKLYNLAATRIAERLADEGAAHSSVQLLSRIGAPIDEPRAVDVTTTLDDAATVRRAVARELDDIDAVTDGLLAGEIATF